ncbi:MAG: tetratricopeptide repeat protein [Nitrospirota bacterium]|nr:MAG: tetratricopeptide repeat protein [Nitrospirota bacterium]
MTSDVFNFLLGLGVCILIGSCATSTGPLATLPISSPQASQLNLEGIEEYNRGQWEPARKKFELAVQADPQLPEAHFNLALTLHKLELHEQATTHFRQAGELAPDNKEIVDSTIYRNHLGLSSTLERHFSGGYRY